MTKYPDLFAALAAPFEPQEVKARAQSGRQLHYVTARTAMNRLDNVLGPENWWDSFVPGENSVLCTITIRLPDGELLAKSDAGGYAGMADSGDDDKSGYSDSFKRAAVKFGVGRYLYRDGVPVFVAAREGSPAAVPPSLGWVHGDDDRVPAAAAPAPPPATRPRPQPQPQAAPPAAERTRVNGKAHAEPPRTGKALFARVKDWEQEHQVGLLKYLNQWAKLQEFPGRMVDWDADQVALGVAEASRKLRSIQAASSESYEEALAN